MEIGRTVHIIDKDLCVRGMLERLLYSAGYDYDAYQSIPEFLEAASAIPSGCVLLDVAVPDSDSLELPSRLGRLRPFLPVIVITGGGDIPTAMRALKAGAVDVIENPFDGQRLLAAIENALTGSALASWAREARAAAARIAALSPRERQVLEALAAGRQSKEIARDLGLSVRTVEAHRARMMGRLGARRLAEAIRCAILAELAPGGPRLARAARRS
jgi:two-component system response regulator FixJ